MSDLYYADLFNVTSEPVRLTDGEREIVAELNEDATCDDCENLDDWTPERFEAMFEIPATPVEEIVTYSIPADPNEPPY